MDNDTDNTPENSDADILQDAKDALKRAMDAESRNRNAWLEDVRFARLGEQWPDAIRRQRELQGRPCLTINRLPAFIRQVTNGARQNKPAIKCHPVGDGADQATAKILNGLIKNIEVSSNADVAYDTALEHAVTGGFGYIRINTDYAGDDSFDQDIQIERVANPLTVFGDPDCLDADSANWNVAIVTELLPKEDFKARWPDAQAADFEADAKDKDRQWFTDDMVRVAEYWVREQVPATIHLLSNGAVMDDEAMGKATELLAMQGVTEVKTRTTLTHRVTQYIVSGAEVLETNAWAGRYIPIVPVYGDEVIVEGERHLLSLVRFAQDPQRMFNYWRTASTELVALAPKAPFVGPKGSFASDADKWGTANTANHAYLEYDVVEGGGPPQRQPFSGPPAGALQEALNANDDMKSIMGLFDASLGARSNETSGIAINQRKQQGDISTFNFMDNQARALRHLGRIIVDLIPRVYNTARMLRVIHEDGTNETVQVNPGAQSPAQPPGIGGPFPGMGGQFPPGMPPGPQPGMPGMGSPFPEQGLQPDADAQGLARVYDLTVGKYDVTVDTGPNFQTKREEAAQQIMDFIHAFPQAGPLVGDLLAKNLDWPGADDMAKRLHAMLPPQILGKNPAVEQVRQQMGAQLQQLDAHAKEAVGTLKQQLQQLGQALQEAEQKLAAVQQDKAVDVKKLHIDGFNAETNRLKVLGTTMDPGAVHAVTVQAVQQALAQPNPLAQEGPSQEELMEQQRLDAILQGLQSLGQAMSQGMQQIAQLVTAERELVTDERGEPIGSRIKQPTAPAQQ